ncbi:chymotrypsin-1 isoform X2 [Fopius arisanus]|uniref:Chymotrypsin-1 isoform X2 n=1 Tax=Fopius arisanus TaxID=64838 RepID=A0A9R1TI58_9HYME|nr:PREDICTED: chymotrypsin-1-like isoform X2 [Fopius arisanus]
MIDDYEDLVQGGTAPATGILLGTEAHLGEFPWMVSIQYDGLHICGGAIISDRHILTAAHCFVDKYPVPYVQNLSVITGSISKYVGGETHRVAKVTAHENFQRGAATRWRNDIAVVELADRLTFGRSQSKIDLPTSSIDRAVDAMLSGFGWIARDHNAERPTILQKADVSVITNDECNRKDGRVFSDQICGLDGKNRGFCEGDSGSPLVYNNRVIGIVSFSPLCGIGYPDVYTRVHSFLNWINTAKSS